MEGLNERCASDVMDSSVGLMLRHSSDTHLSPRRSFRREIGAAAILSQLSNGAACAKRRVVNPADGAGLM